MIEILNRLYANCMVNNRANCLDPIVEELVSYSDYHFSAEEQYMKSIEYKGIDNHMLEHVAFTQRVPHLQLIANKDDFELKKELIVFLGNWLLHHAMEEDKKYAIN